MSNNLSKYEKAWRERAGHVAPVQVKPKKPPTAAKPSSAPKQVAPPAPKPATPPPPSTPKKADELTLDDLERLTAPTTPKP